MTNEDAIEIIETFRLIFDSPEVENKEILLGAIDKAIEALKNERAKGEWESGGFCFSTMSYKCPFCKSKTLERTKFCPECGADMREDGKQ